MKNLQPPLERTTLAPMFGIARRSQVKLDELSGFFSETFRALFEAAAAAGVAPAGTPFARYFSPPPNLDVEAVLPVSAAVPSSGLLRCVELPASDAIQSLHVGPYEAIGAVYEALFRFCRDNNLEPADAPREVYLSPPDAQPPQTLVVLPVRAPAMRAAAVQ